MRRAKEKNDKAKLSFKYRMYPTIESEEKLLRAVQVEAKAQYPSGCGEQSEKRRKEKPLRTRRTC